LICGHPLYIPQDVPEAVRDLFALVTVAESYPYSDFVEIYSAETVPYFLEAGRAIRGSDEALKADPPFSSWAFLTSPLHIGRHGLNICFMLKDFGVQRGFGVGGTMPVVGASAPVTLSGYLVLQVAEVLACNAMNWVLRGKLTGFASGPAALDMRQMLATQSGPEVLLLFLASMDLQRYYGDPEPLFPYALSTEAKTPDIQAGIEKTSSATLAVLAGSRLLSAGVGVLYMAGIASLAQLVIDYELCKFLDRVCRGFEVTAERMGLDVIKSVGIGGSFLGELHTARHMREELFHSQLFDRRSPEQWRADGKGMLEHAKAKAREVLNTGRQTSYLGSEQVAALKRIADHAASKA
jgi:trimethylamine--corrinoid protein Co-methyltransferase